ncbi:hypothetical protein PVK06_009094 [Gossypium arboreum]|uniref:Uncharacterized protein n=1 Tax=Gossypium arboreum TaxID=29729 RepID=A0ABR0QLJ7_GOSAR|nr:hypothetical protein PVK06_009094 [Gossypium arboreum]
MLTSVTSTLYKQLTSCKTVKVILDKLDEMFEDEVALTQQSAITSLMNAQQKLGTLVKNHMITLMGYFVEAMDNEANLEKKMNTEEKENTLRKESLRFLGHHKLKGREPGNLKAYLSLNASSTGFEEIKYLRDKSLLLRIGNETSVAAYLF